MKNTPYTYLIGWSKLGIWYYGCRYAKTCHPGEFWISYHTSSKFVREFRKEHGEPDVIQIRKTFKTGAQARAWEERVIRRMNCVKSDSWLNKANAGKEWNTAGMVNRTAFKPGVEHIMHGLPAWNRGINSLPEKELIRRSRAYSGSGNPNYGKKHSADAIAKIKENRKSKNPNGRHAKPHSAETRERLSEMAKAQGNNAAKTKVCCAFCQKETSMVWFAKNHQNCSA